MRIAVVVLFVVSLATVGFLAAKELPVRSLTVEELALAQGVHWWYLRVPPGVEGQALSLVFVDEEGVRSHGGASGGSRSGDLLKVFVYDLEKEQMGWAIFLPDSLLRDTPRNRFHGLTSHSIQVPEGSEVQPGQVLMKRSIHEGSSLSLTGEMKPGEIGITVSFQE